MTLRRRLPNSASVIVAVAVAACDAAPEQTAVTRDTVSVAAATAPASAPTFPIISADGIGAAKTGMTLRELRAALPPTLRIGDARDDFMVDLRALPVIAGTDTLYYLLFGQPAEATDTTSLELVATLHPNVRTAEGVGPGTTITEAAALYGQPVLSYNINDESREYAAFPDFPARNVLFRVMPARDDASTAGEYQTAQEHNETRVYDLQAKIMMVMVNLRR